MYVVHGIVSRRQILTDQKIIQLLLLIYSFKFWSDFLYYLFSAVAKPRSAIPEVDRLCSFLAAVIVNFLDFR